MLNSTVSTYRVNIHEFSHLTNSIFAKVKNNVVFLKYITNSNNVAMLLSTFQEHSFYTPGSFKQSDDCNKNTVCGCCCKIEHYIYSNYTYVDVHNGNVVFESCTTFPEYAVQLVGCKE